MRIQFIRDYRGILTSEQFYAAGEDADLVRGAEIIAEGAAIPMVAIIPEPSVKVLRDEKARKKAENL